MVQGSTPVSLRESEDKPNTQIDTNFAYLTKVKSDTTELESSKQKLLTEIKDLTKKIIENKIKARAYQNNIIEWRQEQFRVVEAKKQEIKQEQEKALKEIATERKRLDDDIESLVDIAEYYSLLADDLVWESSQNDARAKELKKMMIDAEAKQKYIDERSEEASKLVRQAKSMYETSEFEITISRKVKEDADKKLLEAIQLKSANRLELESTQRRRKILLEIQNAYNEKKKELDNREKALKDREEMLQRASSELKVYN